MRHDVVHHVDLFWLCEGPKPTDQLVQSAFQLLQLVEVQAVAARELRRRVQEQAERSYLIPAGLWALQRYRAPNVSIDASPTALATTRPVRVQVAVSDSREGRRNWRGVHNFRRRTT